MRKTNNQRDDVAFSQNSSDGKRKIKESRVKPLLTTFSLMKYGRICFYLCAISTTAHKLILKNIGYRIDFS